MDFLLRHTTAALGGIPTIVDAPSRVGDCVCSKRTVRFFMFGLCSKQVKLLPQERAHSRNCSGPFPPDRQSPEFIRNGEHSSYV
jgi:hypothetical protein